MEQTYILRRDKEDNDYSRLQNEALKTLQALSGNIWTDFNAHDPGVTIIEVVHYALLELRHILQLPFETFLTNDNEIDFEKLGLYSSQQITKPSIVTPSDYENLIKNSINEVLDCKVTLSDENRYNIKITGNSSQDFVELMQKTEIIYHANRNLCETLGEVSFEINDLIAKRGDNKRNALIPEFESTINKKTSVNSFYSEYCSMQNHLPDCYGVNEKGIYGSVTNERKAQVMQLKAYLLIFDFLLANTHHKVSNIIDLFNLSGDSINPYSLNFSINDIGKLIDDEKFVDCAFESAEYIDTQKSHILDMLEVLYGEGAENLFAKESNEKRAYFMNLSPSLSADRFKSFNILQSNSMSNIKQLMAARLGCKVDSEITLDKLLGIYNLYLMSDKAFFSKYGNVSMESVVARYDNRFLKYKFEQIPAIDIRYADDSFLTLENDLIFLRHNILFESLIKYGGNSEFYRIISSPIRSQFVLAFSPPDCDTWINLGLFSDRDKLISAANLFWQFIEMLQSKSQLFYLIEHILLSDNYDDHNTLTVVIPAWAKWRDEPMFESFLFERLPAHLNIKLWLIEAEHACEFEHNYLKWREALAGGDGAEIGKLSKIIRDSVRNSL